MQPIEGIPATGRMVAGQVLIIEDDAQVAGLIRGILEGNNYKVAFASTLARASSAIETGSFDAAIVDLTLPDGSGMDFLDRAAAVSPETVSLVLTGDTGIDSAVEAIRRGAFDYLTKPIDFDSFLNRLANGIQKARSARRQTIEKRKQAIDLTGQLVSAQSPAMKQVYDRVRRVAGHADIAVLVTGETGVGKEHVARMIHDLSPRASEPFVAINCANLDRMLLQSELFGHERGAFTGAAERRKGLFELATEGTLFLDEVGEMPLEVQAAFLRVLETRRFNRLGGSAELDTNARIVAATNKNLLDLAHSGKFREDLYYRLDVIQVNLPPLRERKEDIRPLVEHYVRTLAKKHELNISLAGEALEKLECYSWPGNVRELKHVIERIVLLHDTGPVQAGDILLDRIPHPVVPPTAPQIQIPGMGSGGENSPKHFTLAEAEVFFIQETLKRCNGNKTQAADALGISRNTLARKLQEWEQALGVPS